MQLAHSCAPERLEAPERFQRRITEAGGKNRYRQPNFKLAWAQTETVRHGGEWDNEDEHFVGYRDVYKSDGLPHWVLMQWCDAGKTAEMPHMEPESDAYWYSLNRCPKTGLSILGEYPYQGSYQIVLPLLAKVFLNGQMFIEAAPLSTEIVEMMVPVIRASMELSIQAKMKFMKDMEAADELERTNTFEDAYRSVKRKATLASAAWLEDKQRSIERSHNAALVTMMARNRRFQSRRPIYA